MHCPSVSAAYVLASGPHSTRDKQTTWSKEVLAQYLEAETNLLSAALLTNHVLYVILFPQMPHTQLPPFKPTVVLMSYECSRTKRLLHDICLPPHFCTRGPLPGTHQASPHHPPRLGHAHPRSPNMKAAAVRRFVAGKQEVIVDGWQSVLPAQECVAQGALEPKYELIGECVTLHTRLHRKHDKLISPALFPADLAQSKQWI